MSTLAAFIVLALPALSSGVSLPQNRGLQLPAQGPRQGAAVVQRPVTEMTRFKRDLADFNGPQPQIERTLQRLAEDYPDLEGLVVQRMRSARPRELQDLMLVARRYPTPRIADEILFQLLARPVAEATRPMIEALYELKAPHGKAALAQLIEGRISGTRRTATQVYAEYADESDLDFALRLVDEQKLDLQLTGVSLLEAVPVARARERLCELLSREPTIAGGAVQALMRVGPDAVPFLRRRLGEPMVDRSHAYAAFALVAEGLAPDQVPDEALAPLARQLADQDPLTRSLAAVVLADLCYRGRAKGVADAEVVDALLAVVVPGRFVPNLDILRYPAEMQLRRLAGRGGDEALSWTEWWHEARPGFAGVREHVAVDAASAGGAVLSLREAGRHLRLLGEELADAAPVRGANEYVLTGERVLQVVEELRRCGFMDDNAFTVPEGLALERTLQLVVGGARMQAQAPRATIDGFERMVAVVERVAAEELWQQLRHPTDEPDRGAYWRAEQRWRREHADPIERGRRLVQRSLRVWSVVTPQSRDMFLAWLLAAPERQELLDEQDGLAMVDIVDFAPELAERHQLLLELAARAPGDQVWRRAIDVAARRAPFGKGVERLFAVLGADHVLSALGDERPLVRRVALDEVVRSQDRRAAGQVIERFADEDFDVRRAAVFAAGELRLPEARVPLIERIIDEQTPALERRGAMVALGKVGGDGAFGVLQQALAAPVPEDRDAALRGLGELRDSRAAAQLASIFVASAGTTTADLARFYLQRMGAALAVPALRAQLETRNEGVRNQVVLLLGAYQDPRVVPDLIGLLRADYERLVVESMLATTTGLDVTSVDDLVIAMDRWYSEHREEPQWSWLIQGLDRSGVPHSLEAAQFAPGAGLQPVPELARLMVECQQGWLRVLAAATLRKVTGEEYGQVLPSTPVEPLRQIAERYRVLYESQRTSQGR